MAHRNTIFSQLLAQISRHEFETLARQHHQGQKFRKTSRWEQFVALSLAHLSGRQSLRDVVSNQKAQQKRLYHTGTRGISRSTLARVNQEQSYRLFEELFYSLYQQCKRKDRTHKFRFKNKLYSVDASFIDLSLKRFPWAKFNRVKGAMKLHIALDHDDHIPAFAQTTHCQFSDLFGCETFDFPEKSIVVLDKGYHNYTWYKNLTDRGIFFVTRLRNNAAVEYVQSYPVREKSGVISDLKIQWNGQYSKKIKAGPLRLVVYRDKGTGRLFHFLTNHFHLSAQTIANIYKERWQVELFFKWMKQHLQMKSFLGTTPNAVMTQIWIALCIQLLLHFMKFLTKSSLSLHQILCLLQLNLFMKRDLKQLLASQIPELIPKNRHCQERLF